MIEPLSLGATLYVPAVRPRLAETLAGAAVPQLRSAVVCLEDAVREIDIPEAMANVARLLIAVAPGDTSRPRLFLRPRDPGMLGRLLDLPGIERIDGFVLPKATVASFGAFVALLEGRPHLLMPTLETAEVFEPDGVRRLRDAFCGARERVLLVRIGGNDLLQILGTRRSRHRTIYEGPLAPTIAALVTAMRPHGIHLSAPVFEHYSRPALLREEVERDLEFGLFSKTAIHPLQVQVIQDAYAVTGAELAAADEILESARPAVFSDGGSMMEPATHEGWAETIRRRADYFGVRAEGTATRANR